MGDLTDPKRGRTRALLCVMFPQTLLLLLSRDAGSGQVLHFLSLFASQICLAKQISVLNSILFVLCAQPVGGGGGRVGSDCQS